MKLKQTAALGLSALIISSNALPCALATPMTIRNQPDLQTFATIGQNPVFLAMAEQQAQSDTLAQDPESALDSRMEAEQPEHPVAKPRRKGMLYYLNPLNLFVSYRTAHSVPMNKPAGKQKQPEAAAAPLTPTVDINPALALSEPPQPEAELKAEADAPAASANKEEAPAAPVGQSQAKAVTGVPDGQPAQPAPAQKPQDNASQLPAKAAEVKPVATQLIGKVPTVQEVFQMLATKPLEHLAAASSSLRAPSFDTGSPDVSVRSSGDVTVLKSGISQKVTQVDLTIGKAQVVYLNKPASRVSISNPDVASAVVISPTQIQLVGKSVGVANLLVWGDMVSPDHTVIDISVHRDVSVLVNQLKHVDPGIQIMPMAAEDTVILSGQAETRESAQLAIEMAKAFFAKNSAGAMNSNGPNSQAPGSAMPGVSTNVINLIKVKGEPSTKVELVRQRLGEIDPGIRLDVVPGPEGNEKVILTGRVANASIASRALNMASIFYGQPGIKMVTGQGGNDFARMQVNSAGGASTSTGGVTNMLQGSVMTDATGNVISMLEIAQKPQVKCSIKFLELSKTALDSLGGTLSGGQGNTMLSHMSGAQSPAPGRGIASMTGGASASTAGRWNPSSGRFTPTLQNAAGNFAQVFQNGATQVLTINNQFTAALQALQEKRQVRTLAEPTITMLSGEAGSFLAGGEVPIAFLGGQGQISIEYKEFGIRLNILPNVTDDGKIQLQVAPEVSTVDQSIAVQGVPGFVTRRMQTTLLVEPGQSFVLAGLFKQEDTDSVSRFPGIGSLPVVGTFFRNKWKDRRNTEMVVIIKPEILYSQTGPTQAGGGNAPMMTAPAASPAALMEGDNGSKALFQQ